MVDTKFLATTRFQKRKIRGLWTHQTLGSLLRNAAYIGMREVNRKNKHSEIKFLKPYQKYQLVKATWLAIIDLKTFEAVQNLLTENLANERRRLKKAERRVFIASSIIHCKECGKAMVVYYGMERFLARLSQSKFKSQFVLKGAFALHVLKSDLARVTRDIDFLAF